MLRRLVSSALSIVTWPLRVAEHRRVLAALGQLDAHELADIGLSRQDLHDVTALPVGEDPTLALAARSTMVRP